MGPVWSDPVNQHKYSGLPGPFVLVIKDRIPELITVRILYQERKKVLSMNF